MTDIPFIELKDVSHMQLDNVAPKVACVIPFARLSAVTHSTGSWGNDCGIIGLVTQSRLRLTNSVDDEPCRVTKLWLLQLGQGPTGTFQWQDFLPTCEDCSVHMNGIIPEDSQQPCPVCKGRSGVGACFQFNCPEDTPLSYGCGKIAPANRPVYCGSHPLFSGYEVSDGLLDPAKRALFELVEKDSHSNVFCTLTASGRARHRLVTNMFFEGKEPTFRAVVTSNEQSIVSKFEVKSNWNTFFPVTSCLEIAKSRKDHSYILIEQNGLHVLRSVDEEPKKWKDRSTLQFPEGASGFHQQLVKVSDTLVIGLSDEAMWAIVVPKLGIRDEALTSAVMATKISCRQILRFPPCPEDESCDQQVERLLALGPAPNQVVIFQTDDLTRQHIRPRLLVEIQASAESMVAGKIHHITSLEYVPFYPQGVDRSVESRAILPNVIRDKAFGGYLFFDRLGQVHCLRDEAIVSIEHIWSPPNFKPTADMQRSVIFNFPGSSEDAKICPLGLLTRYPYFKSLFTGWLEGTSGEVEVSDADPKTVDCMLQYLFTGDVSCKFELGLLVNVLVLANKYLMLDLLALVLVRIVDVVTDGKRMESQSVLGLAELLSFSEVAQTSCPTLQKNIVSSILKYRIEVVEDPAFLKVVAAGSVVALAKLLQHIKKKPRSYMLTKRRRLDEDSFTLAAEQPVPVWASTSTSAEIA